MSLTGNSDYRFGAFEFSTRRQLLVHAGAPLRVPSRALAILTVLVEAAGDLVTKKKLVDAAWPATFVDDSNLKVNVASLRRALASVDPGREFIATVQGHGYRFVAPVHRISITSCGLPPKIPLIGRSDDLSIVQTQLIGNSVVTIVGSGGVGKTALATHAAYEVAARYSDGVAFVDLAKISSSQFILAAIALALRLKIGDEDPLAEVVQALHGKRKLLLIDNCEHLLPSVAHVIHQLSTNLVTIRILATSREPLRIRDEHVYRLNSLESGPRVSTTAAQARAHPAVELLVTRAFESTGYELCDADASGVVEICRRLDGIPLAIEVAATRIGVLTPARVLEMLNKRHEILEWGSCKAPGRQQTLYATLDWSYRLLSGREAAFLRALSVLPCEFGVEGAIALAPNDVLPETSMDILSMLAAKSIVMLNWRNNVMTYRLSETMRVYLLERLRLNGEEIEASNRHATFVRSRFLSAREGGINVSRYSGLAATNARPGTSEFTPINTDIAKRMLA